MNDIAEGTLESQLSPDQKLQMADDNHIWLNAFSCVSPTDEFLRELGSIVMRKLNDSPVSGDLLGVRIGKVVYIRLNKS